MSENKGGVSEKLAKKVSSLNPKDQIGFMERLPKSVAERDLSLVKEILLILIIASLALRISERGRSLPNRF